MSQFVHLTQVTTIYSMPADGGLPSNTGGVRGALPLGTGLPGISVPAPLAGGLPLPALRCRQGLAPAFRSVAVRGLRPPSFGDGRIDPPGHAHSAHVWFRAMGVHVNAVLPREWKWMAVSNMPYRGRPLTMLAVPAEQALHYDPGRKRVGPGRSPAVAGRVLVHVRPARVLAGDR